VAQRAFNICVALTTLPVSIPMCLFLCDVIADAAPRNVWRYNGVA
jgi:lipopolysaccharide/colanic/teichoic acid biosynthesis glycosyltransferase